MMKCFPKYTTDMMYTKSTNLYRNKAKCDVKFTVTISFLLKPWFITILTITTTTKLQHTCVYFASRSHKSLYDALLKRSSKLFFSKCSLVL